jgi:putative nucleotidyltransferase-like protein
MDQAPTTQWLREGLREGDAATKAARLGGLSPDEWNEVVASALANQVGPLLYSRLKELADDGRLPRERLQVLRAAYLATAERNLRLYRELAVVLTALRQAGIPVIVLKGAHLAKAVYGNIALRPMGDLDLLVKAADLSRAAAALRDLGYAAEAYGPSAAGQEGKRPPDAELAGGPGHHLPPFVRPGAAAAEVHWTLAHTALALEIDLDGLWARAQPVVLGGAPTLGLGPVDLLLHQCLHAGEHHGFRIGLRPFCDVAQILRHCRAELAWDEVRLRARQWRTANGVYMTLRLLGGLLEPPVPEAVLAALRPPDFDENWEIEADRQFHALDFGAVRHHLTARKPAYGSSRFIQLMGRKPLRAKVGILRQALFPSRAEMGERYRLPAHSRRVYLLYPVRIGYLTFKYCRLGCWLAWHRPQEWFKYVAMANDLHYLDRHLHQAAPKKSAPARGRRPTGN